MAGATAEGHAPTRLAVERVATVHLALKRMAKPAAQVGLERLLRLAGCIVYGLCFGAMFGRQGEMFLLLKK